MKKIKDIKIIFALLFALSAGDSYGADTAWIADIWSKVGNDSTHVLLGSTPRATDEFDKGQDAPLMVLQGSRIKSYFYHSFWSGRGPMYFVDVRNYDYPKTWTFTVETTRVNSKHIMFWNLRNVPDTINLVLTDLATGSTYDLKQDSDFVFYPATSKTNYEVTVEGFVEGVIVDNAAPDTYITTEMPSLASSSGLEISYSGTDNVSDVANLAYSYSVDSGAWSSYSASTSAVLNNLSSGTHTFNVMAKDEAGNVDETPASISFEVDSSKPQLEVDMRIKGKAIDRGSDELRVVFKGTASDDYALSSLTYTINDEYNEMNITSPITVLSRETFSTDIELIKNVNVNDNDGQRTYTVTFKATDSAGNVTEVEKIINIKKFGRHVK